MLRSKLQAKSFLRRTPTGRYDLHELVRQYAARLEYEEAPQQALESAFFVMNHRAATKQTKEAAHQLCAELLAQSPSTPAEAIQAHAGKDL